MEHSNPLLRNNNSPKFITIGEVMLRLTPPNYDKIRVATSFDASYGGSEANIARHIVRDAQSAFAEMCDGGLCWHLFRKDACDCDEGRDRPLPEVSCRGHAVQ